MSLDFYFKPVEKIDFQKGTIGSKSDIFIKNFPDWDKSDIVILSVDDNRGDLSFNTGAIDHQMTRERFYNYKINSPIKIADLGILHAGANLSDTFLALREITTTVQKKDKLLKGVKLFFRKIPKKDKIIITTSRNKEYSKITIDFLKKNKINFDEIIFNLPFGERILINDIKPKKKLRTAKSINLKRNSGLLNYSLILK